MESTGKNLSALFGRCGHCCLVYDDDVVVAAAVVAMMQCRCADVMCNVTAKADLCVYPSLSLQHRRVMKLYRIKVVVVLQTKIAYNIALLAALSCPDR